MFGPGASLNDYCHDAGEGTTERLASQVGALPVVVPGGTVLVFGCVSTNGR